MRFIARLLPTAALAAAVLLATVASASARDLRMSSTTNRIVWAVLEFENTVGAAWTCPMTLEGNFAASTIAKIARGTIGRITAAAAGATETCTGGEMTILRESLPWRTTYEGFTATLPAIRTIRLLLLGAAFKVHASGSFTCLMKSEVMNPMHAIARLNETTGRVESLENEAGTTLPLTGEAGFCSFARGKFKENPSTVTNGSGASITITLI